MSGLHTVPGYTQRVLWKQSGSKIFSLLALFYTIDRSNARSYTYLVIVISYNYNYNYNYNTIPFFNTHVIYLIHDTYIHTYIHT